MKPPTERGWLIRLPERGTLAGPVLLALASTLYAATAAAQLEPGLLVDPPRNQMTADAAYNPALDEYFITFRGDHAHGIRLSPCGQVLDEVTVLEQRGDSAVSQVAIDYNPDRDEYLAVIRYDNPQDIVIRYLDTFGAPIGEPIAIVLDPDKGCCPDAVYSPDTQQYLVRWNRGSLHTLFRMVDGDSDADSALIGEPVVLHPDGFSAQAAYGRGTGQFLAVFTVDNDQSEDTDVHGRFIFGDGTVQGDLLSIRAGPRKQTGSQLAYAPPSDRWLVTVHDWINHPDNHQADVSARLMDSAGVIHQELFIAETADGMGDVPGPIAYHPDVNRFFATWWVAGSAYYRTVDPDSGAVGPVELISSDVARPTAVAVRPHALNPQVLFTWRRNFNGIYAGIVSLSGECTDAVVDAPEPESSDDPDVADAGHEGEPPADAPSPELDPEGDESLADVAAPDVAGEIGATADSAQRAGQLEAGCGCNTGEGRGPDAWLALLLIALVGRRLETGCAQRSAVRTSR